jgi:hypothetical protein
VRSLLMLGCLIASIYAMSRMGDSIAGAWVCSAVNAGAHSARSCTSEPGLHLNEDHTYQWGREKGAWQVRLGVVRFSDLQAIGRLNSDGKLITEFDRNGKHYVLTFYKRW